MKLLALDTSTADATVALVDERCTRAEAMERVTTHSEGLFALIDAVLRAGGVALQQVDALVCGAGPGSFTGLRIGLATAKGLCFAAQKPLVCPCSLDALGLAGAREHGAARPVLALIDARRGQLYGRLYRGGLASGPPFVETFAQLRARIVDEAQILAVGEGALQHADELVRLDCEVAGDPAVHRISAAQLARAARSSAMAGQFTPIGEAAPIYLRAPDLRPSAGAAS